MPTYSAPNYVSSLGPAFLARRLLRLSDAFVDDIETFLREAGLITPARAFSSLLLLQEAPGLAIMQVAAQIQMSHPLIINLLSQLEQLKLVYFCMDESDRRRRLIYLTPEGEAEAAQIRAALPAICAAYAELSAEADVDLMAVIDRLDAAMARRPFLQRLRALSASPAPMRAGQD